MRFINQMINGQQAMGGGSLRRTINLACHCLQTMPGYPSNFIVRAERSTAHATSSNGSHLRLWLFVRPERPVEHEDPVGIQSEGDALHHLEASPAHRVLDLLLSFSCQDIQIPDVLDHQIKVRDAVAGYYKRRSCQKRTKIKFSAPLYKN